MKNYSLIIVSFSVLALMLIIGCQPEPLPPGPTTEVELPPPPMFPELTLADSVGFISMDDNLDTNEEFKVLLSGQMGDTVLSELIITANGEVLDNSRFQVKDKNFTSSQIDILGTDRDNFEYEITFVSQDLERKVQYRFELWDHLGQSKRVSIIIDTRKTPFTLPTMEVEVKAEDCILAFTGATFQIDIEVPGAKLEEIKVFQGFSLIEPERIIVDGMTSDSNPYIIQDADAKAFSKEISLITNDLIGNQTYTLEVIDSLERSFYVDLNFDVFREISEEKVFLTRDIVGTSIGGLDFDNRVEVGRDANTADIKISKETGNVIPGSDLRAMKNQISLQTYNDVDLTKEFDEIWSNANPVDSFTVLSVDDIFIAQTIEAFYLIKVTEVNLDRYEFEMKY